MNWMRDPRADRAHRWDKAGADFDQAYGEDGLLLAKCGRGGLFLRSELLKRKPRKGMRCPDCARAE